MTEILRVNDLTTRFFTEQGQVNAVESVSFTVGEGEVFGIVGESGSGKSVTALSLIDLVESPGRITGGEIWYRDPALADTVADAASDGEYVDLLRLDDEQRRLLRGTSFSMVFQDPMSSFNPTVPVGEQIAEAVENQRRASARPRSTRSRSRYGLGSFVGGLVLPSMRYISEESMDRAVELLDMVGIPDPAQRAEEYPHQFSGGMLQRAMIAQALACEPDVLIADEPTTALDVTMQAEILELLSALQEEYAMSILLITHNLGVIARTCDRLSVMYAGELVEGGTLEDIFAGSVHPYTAGLLQSVPTLTEQRDRLDPIDGNVPSLLDEELPEGCYFADRCPKAMTDCLENPPRKRVGEGHAVKCYLADREYDPSRAIASGTANQSGDAEPGPAEEAGADGDD